MLTKKVFEKHKRLLQLDFHRAKRYNIPLSVYLIEIDDSAFLEKIRSSDNIVDLGDNLYLVTALFCGFDCALETVKRLKRDYTYYTNKKDLPIYYVSFEENIPTPSYEFFSNLVNSFEEHMDKGD